MSTTPIICQGEELEGVLADIRESGGVVTALQTGVGGNAGYRVNYFERVASPESGESRCQGKREIPRCDSLARSPIRDSASSQETPPVMADVSQSSPVSGKVGQGESRSCDAASMAVGRAGRNPETTPGAEKSRMGAHPKANPASAEPNEQEEYGGRTQHLSIETRMAAIQEFVIKKMIERRDAKFRNSSIKPRDARLPHAND